MSQHPLFMKKAIATAAGCLIAWASFAQKTNLGNEEVEVVKPYQPVLSDAIKITSSPQRDTLNTEPPVFNYAVEEKRHATAFNITPIKPVRIKDENIKELYRGFVKAGYGNYNTLYGEGFFNALRSKNFDAGIHLKHLSNGGKIKDYGYPGAASSGIKAHGKKFFESSALDGSLVFQREVNHFYGFKIPDIFSKKETRQTRGWVQGRFGFESIQPVNDRFFYRAEVFFSSFNLKTSGYSASETDFEMSFMGGKKLGNDHKFKAEVNINPVKTVIPRYACPPGQICPAVVSPDVDISRNIVRIRPRYEFEKSGIQFSAGANLAFEKSYDLSFWRFYPVAGLHYPLIKDQLSFSAEISGDLKKNTLQSFTDENPWIVTRELAGEKFLLNTNNKLNLSGGFIIRPERQLQFLFKAGYSRLLEQAFFINSLNTSGITFYNVAFDTLNRINFHAEAQYAYFEKAGITFKTDFFSYDMNAKRQPVFMPSFTAGLEGFYNIAEKIYAKTMITYTGTRKALAIDGYQTLNAFTDISLGVDYRYSKILSFWFQANNLTAGRYMLWYNYPSYRLNVMAGASLAF
jgi:hypothetical protein